MSGWERFGWFPRTKKRPPPEHGIKIGRRSGTTWWGKRWIEALERLAPGYSARLARGRTYARAGRVHDLAIEGVVSAKVTGSRRTPYLVTISVAKLPDEEWSAAIAAMAAKAQFAAELLSGRMPEAIDEAFGGRSKLFPTRESDLATHCSCPDWANPCKHVAATHYVLGDALDRDPFLLFELRGRTKAQVLDALREARAGAGKARGPARRRSQRARAAPPGGMPDAPSATVRIGRISAADYDRPRAPWPAFRLSFDGPPVPCAAIRQLGAPPGWSADASPAELLSPLVRAAAERARAIALAEPADPQAPAPAPTKTPPRAHRGPRPRSSA